MNTADCTTIIGGGKGPTDAGRAPDAGACTAIEVSTFDASCQQDADCVSVGVGNLCTNGSSCICAAGTINVGEESRYDAYRKQLESKVTQGSSFCSCPFFGSPHCAGGKCVHGPNASAAVFIRRPQ